MLFVAVALGRMNEEESTRTQVSDNVLKMLPSKVASLWLTVFLQLFKVGLKRNDSAAWLSETEREKLNNSWPVYILLLRIQWNLYSGDTFGTKGSVPGRRLAWGLLIIKQQVKYFYSNRKKAYVLTD